MATGRSDTPNQVNNVLGFPFIFRGALDVRATDINRSMKLAAVEALAALAREDVPDPVLKAYGLSSLKFGTEYLIPKPFDYRVLLRVAPAVARAAIESGVARLPIDDFETYRRRLETLISRRFELMRGIIDRARLDPGLCRHHPAGASGTGPAQGCPPGLRCLHPGLQRLHPRPRHVLQRGVEVMDIVNMAAICVVDALEREAAGGEKARP